MPCAPESDAQKWSSPKIYLDPNVFLNFLILNPLFPPEGCAEGTPNSSAKECSHFLSDSFSVWAHMDAVMCNPSVVLEL